MKMVNIRPFALLGSAAWLAAFVGFGAEPAHAIGQAFIRKLVRDMEPSR